MKKILLALAAVILMSGGVSAQKVSGLKAVKAEAGIVDRQKTGVLPVKKSPLKARKKIELADNEKIFGNYSTDELVQPGYGLGLPGYPGKLSVATWLPITETSKFNGSVIKSIRFGLDQAVGAARVFLIPVDATGAPGAAVVSQNVESTVVGWNNVVLDEPYTINAENVVAYLLGFEYTQVNTNDGQYYDLVCYPLSLVSAGASIMPTYVYGNLGQGTGWYDLGAESYGNLSVQCIVEKEGGFPLYDLLLGDMSAVPFVKKDGTVSFSNTVWSDGKADPTSFTVGVSLDGTEVATINQENLTFTDEGVDVEGTLALPAGTAIGEHLLQMYVKAINGEAATADNTPYATFNVYTESLPRQKQLVEHFTSQYCTYCPLGINILEKLVAKRNDIAWVSVHGDMQSGTDQYTITDGNYISGFQTTGFPSASFNRVLMPGEDALGLGLGYGAQYTDMAVEYLSNVIDYTNEIPALASVNIDAEYDAAAGKLNVKVSGETLDEFTRFVGTDAALTVYLTEDGLVSKQLNQGKWITSFTHDNVLRKVVTNVYGDALKMSGNKYENTYSVALDNSWNKDNMHVVAFVSRKPSNANLYDKLWVTNTETAAITTVNTAIETVSGNGADVKEVARYSADGRSLTAPQKGLNIVKLSDGSVVKEIVR